MGIPSLGSALRPQSTAASGRGRGPHPLNVRDGGGVRRVDRGHLCRGNSGSLPRDGWSSSVKKLLATAAAASLAALTACSVSVPDNDAASAPPSQPEPGPARTSAAVGGSAGTPSSSPAQGTKAACELFNSLFERYAAVPSDDSEGYEDVYLQAEEAKGTVSGDLRGLFASLSLLAIDRSGSAGSGSGAAQESEDAVRDAVFANAGTCTDAGVTLRL